MATAKLYLEKPKEKESGKLKTVEVAILVKVSIDRDNRFQSTTKERIVPKYWDFKKQCVKSNFRGHIELNHSLDKIKVDMIQLWRDNKSLSMDALKTMADNLIQFGQAVQPVQKKSLLDVLKLCIDQYKKDKDSKTTAKLESLEVKLQLFPKPKGGLFVEDLDMNFYDAFKNFLYAFPNRKYKGKTLHLHESGDYWEIRNDDRGEPIGLFDNTVMKYLINLKTVLDWAKERGYNVHPSFEKWEIIRHVYKPISFTLAEVNKLQALEVDPDFWDSKRKTPKRKKWPITWGMRKAKAVSNGRDYIVAECRTGQRISDLKRFDNKDLDGFKWSFFPRKRNRLSPKKINVFFHGYSAPALEIFAKHDFKMPKISEQKLNDSIKVACMMAGIDQEISIYRWIQNKRVKITGPKYQFVSTHTGRKTFITIALQTMTPRTVMQLTGIGSLKTLDHYMDDSEDEHFIDGLKRIEDNTLMRKAQ